MNAKRTVQLIFLGLLLLFPVAGMAHGDEDHGTPPAAATPGQSPKSSVQSAKTDQGSFKVTLTQRPANPKSGEEAQFEFRVVELVEGGLAGGELPLTDARVTVSVRDGAGKVVAAKLETHRENQPAVFGVHYTFEGGGQYVLAVAVTTDDNRTFGTEFQTQVRAKPFNFAALTIQMLLAFLAVGFVARSVASARAEGRSLPRALAATAVASLTVLLAAGITIYLAGRYLPSFAKPEVEATVSAPPNPNGAFEITKEAQLKFQMTTDAARLERLTTTLSVNGKVTLRTQFVADVTPPVAGRILPSARRFTLGDRVAAGTVIAVVEQTLPAQDAAALELNRLQIRNDRAKIESEVRQNTRRLDQARVDASRAENLYAIQAIPLKELQQARLAVSLAEDDLKRANIQLETYKTSDRAVSPTRRFEVRAPLSGVIVETALTAGEYVEPTKVLLKIADTGRMWIEAQVFEADLDAVRGSRTATFTIPGSPDRTFVIDGTARGKLVTVGAVLNPQTKTIPVVYEVENRDGLLKDGMFAAIRIASLESRECVTVPKSAVYDDAGRKYVYVFLGGETFEQRDAVVGIETDDRVELKTGLKTGDRVVVNGIRQLRAVALQGGM